MTGVGLTFPVITLVIAFACLFGMGGAPLFAIARGAGEEERAEKIMGNVFSMLILSSLIIMVFCYIFKKSVLYLFGASDASFVYADAYLKIYLIGTPFAMLTTGMNGFINGQGFPKIGMLTTVIGAVLNLVLDPIFIFVFDMGVSGAALATILSQMVSALWIMGFLTGKKAILHMRRSNLRVDVKLTWEVMALGVSGFIMQATNCLVQIVCNKMLQSQGGDLYVGIMTVLNSVREMLTLPVMGIANGSQPVLGYNYGAKQFQRVKEGIRFTSVVGICYTFIVWILVMVCPKLLISIFSNDVEMLTMGPEALNLYFFGFFFMAFPQGHNCGTPDVAFAGAWIWCKRRVFGRAHFQWNWWACMLSDHVVYVI